jgi:ureidoglycolate hydrolase
MALGEELLQVSSHDEPGYAPAVDFGEWRVALLNRCEDCAPEGIKRMERHNETDEVFVLLEGRAILFIAEPAEAGESRDTVGRIHSCPMERSKLYNIRRAAWHACAVSGSAKVLIVENHDTTEANSDYIDLDDAQRAILASDAAALDA